MLKLRAGAAIAALTFAPFWSSPAIADGNVLQARASSQWHVALEDGLCHLVRTFDAGDAGIQFILRRRAPYHPYELNIVSDNIPHRKRVPVTQYDAGTEPVEHEVSYHLSDGEWDGFSVSLSGDYFDSPVEQSLTVSNAFAEDFTLPLNRIGSALQVMDQCLDEVVRSWGLDPVQQRGLTKLAEPDDNVSELIIEALRRTRRESERLGQDSLYTTILVGADGRPTRCTIEGVVGNSNSGQAACRTIMRNARFDPALDADGQAVESFVVLEGYTYTRRGVYFL